jgi:hypothetical protein
MRDQVDRLKAVGDCIEQNAPRNEDGALYAPFTGWLEKCRREEKRAREWLGNAGQEPEPAQPAGKSKRKKKEE